MKFYTKKKNGDFIKGQSFNKDIWKENNFSNIYCWKKEKNIYFVWERISV